MSYKGLVLFFLSSQTNKRETKFNNHGNPGPGSTTTMFGKKSNLCCGQNAFLSHYNRSLLKACQEITKTLFVQLPTSLYLIQQILAFSEMQSKMEPKRTCKRGEGKCPQRALKGMLTPQYLPHQRLCLHHPLLNALTVQIRFNQEVHVSVKSHPSWQRGVFILQREGGSEI